VVPPLPGRRSLFSRVLDRLPIDSTVVLVVLIAALATGAGGMLLAANDTRPPTVVARATLSPGSTTDAIAPGQPTAKPPATSAPTEAPGTAAPTATQTPRPTATPKPEPVSAPPVALTGYVWPLVDARMTSKFGARSNGFVSIDGKLVHDGLDLATWCGDKVRAAHSGTVLYAGRKFDPYLGYSQPLGNFYDRISNLNSLPIVLVIDDGNGYRSVYVHLSVAKVGAGDVVKAGQTIGLEGATGHATGCHLHYGLIRMDGPWQAVAPEHVGLYPPLVRERVDPLLVFPLRHPDAPARIREKFGPFDPGLPFDPPAAGPAGS
jgi:murein DD-endopeptidase MepM/ murein hydrolase activator NlpD